MTEPDPSLPPNPEVTREAGNGALTRGLFLFVGVIAGVAIAGYLQHARPNAVRAEAAAPVPRVSETARSSATAEGAPQSLCNQLPGSGSPELSGTATPLSGPAAQVAGSRLRRQSRHQAMQYASPLSSAQSNAVSAKSTASE